MSICLSLRSLTARSEAKYTEPCEGSTATYFNIQDVSAFVCGIVMLGRVMTGLLLSFGNSIIKEMVGLGCLSFAVDLTTSRMD